MGEAVEIRIAIVVADPSKQVRYRNILWHIFEALDDEVPKLSFYATSADSVAAIKAVGSDLLIMQASSENFVQAEKMRLFNRSCIIIYPAADLRYVLPAFQSMPRAYIVPKESAAVSSCTLSEAILSAALYILQSRKDLYIETKSRLLRYSLHEIDYIESQYRLIRIVKNDLSEEFASRKLDEIEQLHLSGFIRCHQSYLVNAENIVSVDKTNRMIHFWSGQTVPSSKKLFTGFMDKYLVYLGADKTYVESG